MARRFLVLAASGLLAVGLAGCATGDGFPIFDREPTAQDGLPSDFPDIDLESYDADSIRFAGSHEDVDLFVIRMENGTPCLLVEAGRKSSIGCGGGGSVEVSTPFVGTFRLGPAPMPSQDGWTAVSENVQASDGEE